MEDVTALESAAHRGYPQTHWSIILSSGNPVDRQKSLEYLFNLYAPVLYGYFRWLARCGLEEAKDFVQSFFLYLLEHDTLAKADPSRGRFRIFLRTIAKGFWRDRKKWDQAEKRGGGSPTYSLDPIKEALWSPTAPGESPDQMFDRAWAKRVLERAVAETESELRAANRPEAFEIFRVRYIDPGLEGYEEIAQRVGRTTSQVRHGLAAARDVFRQELRDIVSEVVEAESHIDAEIAYLLELTGSALS